MKNQKGITLVALIITIIVMVILAGVIIASAVADGGIIDRAQEAMKEKERAEAEELVIASYVYKTTASMTTVGTLDLNATADAIYENLTSNGFILMDGNTQAGSGSDILETDKIKLDIVGKHGNYGGTVTDKGLEGNIGIVEENDTTGNENTTGDEDISSKYDEYLQLAKEKGQNIEDNPDIGIGTDGEVVNLDLWHYYKTDDGEGMSIGKYEGSNSSNGYDEENLVNGKIQGKMPEKIYKKDQDIVYPVTTIGNFLGWGMGNEFELTEFPELPTTITTIEAHAFWNCTKLKSVSIPDSVTYLGMNAFCNCESLESIKLSKSLETIEYGPFYGCVSLKSIVIPATLTVAHDLIYNTGVLEVYFEHQNFENTEIYGFLDSSLPTRTFYFKSNEALESFKTKYDVTGYGILSTDFNW